MSRPLAKGWCPGAYRPMLSGDGLVVRVRPIMGRLDRTQALGLAELAQEFGSGLIDLTSRANLQIRGVQETDHEALLRALNRLELLPDDPYLEARRNILVVFDWQDDDVTARLSKELIARLRELPDLPAKVGSAIDTGREPLLPEASADFRLERAATGLILRADGASHGRPVSEATAVEALIEMAHWFVNTGGSKNRRMKHHVAQVALPSEWTTTARLKAGSRPSVGRHPLGAIYGAPFGQIAAEQLSDLVKRSACTALRMTPWRLFLTEDAAPLSAQGFVTRPDDPLLQIDACPGSPLCASATVNTRELAHRLAAKTSKRVHVSGCSKGCARPRPAELSLVGREGVFDLVKNGSPWDQPDDTGLSPDLILSRIGDL